MGMCDRYPDFRAEENIASHGLSRALHLVCGTGRAETRQDGAESVLPITGLPPPGDLPSAAVSQVQRAGEGERVPNPASGDRG